MTSTSTPSTFKLPLYLGARSTSEYGDAPEFTRIDVDQEFLDTLQRLKEVHAQHGLTELRIEREPIWTGAPEDMDLDLPELVVVSDAFWFTAQVSGADYGVESGQHCISTLEALFAQRELAGDASPVFETDDVQRTAEEYAERHDADEGDGESWQDQEQMR